jgi:hypothetical protein
LRGSPAEAGIKPFFGYRPASASSLFVGPIEILETGIRRHQTGERRHAHYVGYTMGYPSEHGVNLTFEINYLRVAVNPTLPPIARTFVFARIQRCNAGPRK